LESSIDQQPGVRRAHTLARDAVDAVREFHAAVAQDDMVLVVFFCSSSYDLDRLGAEMKRAFAGIEVIGCTTAGEIGPAGYVAGSLSGMSFAASRFTAVCGCIERLRQFDIAAGQAFGKDLLQRMGQRGTGAAGDNTFALLLIDGMSVREEPVARAVQSVLGAIPLVGGSAASSGEAIAPVVYYGGRFAHDRAVVALLSTPLPVRLFETHHFVASDERLVVTEADTERRVVKEINGLPAAQEYARRLGVAPHELGPEIFSASPVVVLIDGKSYVRSIHKANADGSLTFFCAIENGLILRIAHTGDLYGKLADSFAQLRSEIGQPLLVIACECVLRRAEVLRSAQNERIVDLLLANRSTGFCTYGEQYRGIHLNQTLTAVAIGQAPGGGGDDA
jgi:hypothetical protein